MATIPTVVDDELIETAWGNAVATELNTRCVKVDGTPSMTNVRLTSTSASSLASTAHAFQAGPTNSANLIADTNGVQARNNGAAANLNLNESGGTVICGAGFQADSAQLTTGDLIVVVGDVLVNSGAVAAEAATINPGDLTVTLGDVLVPSGASRAGSLNPASSVAGSFIRDDGAMSSCVTTGASPGSLANINLHRVGAQAQQIGGTFITFDRTPALTDCGSITISSATAVAYNTSSDPRLKENLGPITDSAARVQQLGSQAFRGRWKADLEQGEEWDMLSSVDIETVAPYAVLGLAGAVDGDGKIVAQQVDYGSLVPLLVSALSDALDRIAVLEAGV